ncbi:hypothetical protein IU483_16525 [Streptomyces gardneri]|nr:hypothetical protein [Streptomyces gardneri]
MARMNHPLTGVDTVFIASDPAHGFVSSSLVKEVAAADGDLTGLLPAPVRSRLLKRL